MKLSAIKKSLETATAVDFPVAQRNVCTGTFSRYGNRPD